MFRKTRRLLALALLFAPIDLLAQDVTGLYSLSATQNPGQNDCTWSGSLELNQTGGNPGSFTGSGAANLAIGGSPCADFQGTATGTINGSALDFGIGVGALGTVVFNGTVAADGSITGSWSGFTTFSGTWVATPLQSEPVPIFSWPLLLLLLAMIGGFGAFRYKNQIVKALK